MSQAQTTISEMIKQLQTGEIAPGSNEGIEAIRQIASSGKADIVTNLYHLPNKYLERGMRAAGISKDDIDDILRNCDDVETPTDPFSESVELTPDKDADAMRCNPNEFDPAADMRNGPRPR